MALISPKIAPSVTTDVTNGPGRPTMLLAHYLEGNGLSASAFARQLGISTLTVLRYARAPGDEGALVPDRALMVRIYQATGGAVGPRDFYDLGPEAEGAAD